VLNGNEPIQQQTTKDSIGPLDFGIPELELRESIQDDGGAEISVGIDGFNMSLEDTSVGTIIVVFIVCMTIVACAYLRYASPNRKEAKDRKTRQNMKAIIDREGGVDD